MAENFRGDLQLTYLLAQNAGFRSQLAREITSDGMINLSIRDVGYTTGDGSVYRVEDGSPVHYFTPTHLNPVLNNIQDAYHQLNTNRQYRVAAPDMAAILESHAAGTSLRTELGALNLSTDHGFSGRFVLESGVMDILSPERKAVVDWVLGLEGVDLQRYFDNVQHQTSFQFLMPSFVMEYDEGIGYAKFCRLAGLQNEMAEDFDCSMDMPFAEGVIRAVPKSVGIDGYLSAIDLLLSIPESEIEHISAGRVAQLADLVGKFLRKHPGPQR